MENVWAVWKRVATRQPYIYGPRPPDVSALLNNNPRFSRHSSITHLSDLSFSIGRLVTGLTDAMGASPRHSGPARHRRITMYHSVPCALHRRRAHCYKSVTSYASSRSVLSLRMPRFANSSKSRSPGVVKSLFPCICRIAPSGHWAQASKRWLIGSDPLAVFRALLGEYILGRSQYAQCYHGFAGSVA
jgi:hypothetical protein